MHLTVIILLVIAGLGVCLAGLLRWRAIGRAEASTHDHLWPLWLAFISLTAGTAIAILGDRDHRDLGFGALALWACIASLLFLSRWLAMPSRSLLALPLGAVALMVATAGVAGPTRTATDNLHTPWIVYLHAAFMSLHIGAVLLAGTGGGLYLIAAWLLKNPSPRALRLPNLRMLERLTDRSFIVGTALLVGGLATGGAAMHLSPDFRLFHPTALLGIATMVMLLAILVLRSAHRLGNRSMALAAVLAATCAVLSALSQVALAHG